MPNFLENVFVQLQRSSGRVVLREIHGEQFVSATGNEVLELVERVRVYLRASGLKPGDRCALLASNSIRWVAFDLALMAEGLIVVPLYFRQAPAELVVMMKDCQPSLLIASDAALASAIVEVWPDAPPRVLFDDVLKKPTPQSPKLSAPNPKRQRP